MVRRFSTLLAYGTALFTALIFVGPAVVGHYALFEITSLRPLTTMMGAAWLMLTVISIQLADLMETGRLGSGSDAAETAHAPD